jgi:hypothetical protein
MRHFMLDCGNISFSIKVLLKNDLPLQCLLQLSLAQQISASLTPSPLPSLQHAHLAVHGWKCLSSYLPLYWAPNYT